jgi:predicted metalloprotease
VRSTVTKTETEHPTADAAPASTLDSDAAIRADTAQAVSVVERYWTDLFSTWVDPAGNPVYWVEPTLWNGDGFYDSAAGDLANCGTDYNSADNAFFCGDAVSGTGYLAWDMQLFRNESAFGPLIIYITVGHEMGHAAQVRFEHDGQGPAVLADRELQADCISGATLHKAAQDGYLTVDENAMHTALLAFTDAPAGDPHGTAQDRRTWFNRGYNRNIESCLGHR